jgi:tetratricopeptide (TPR) repeat protein
MPKKKRRAQKSRKPASKKESPRPQPFLLKPIIHVLLIAALGVLAYSNTFNVPFVFDDKEQIADNPVVKDLRYFTSPSEADNVLAGNKLYTFRTRYIGYLTFALNYRLHGLDVAGYHIVNLIIHILNALLVYWLLGLTFKTPFFSSMKNTGIGGPGLISLLAALLFVAHPVQTQAVTYVVQRLASLVTLFYLFSLVMYIKTRLAKSGKSQGIFYALSLVSAVLAMKTKENAFTLPFAIVLYELMFLNGNLIRRAKHLMPLLLTSLIIPFTLLGISSGNLHDVMGSITSSKAIEISQGDYILTQFRVIVTYVRLLILPLSQNLDYDYPIYRSFFDPEVFLSFLFLLLLFGFGIYLYYRSRSADIGLRLSAFGIFWFFITLSVESSVIPIADVVFEHRAYLPGVGAFMAIVPVSSLLLEKITNKNVKKFAVLSIVLVILVFSCAAYGRNNVWGSELGLWEDTVRKSPGKARPHNNLGEIYGKGGRHSKALKELQTALKINPDYAEAYNNLGNVYDNLGRYNDAVDAFQSALMIDPNDAATYNNLGIVYDNLGKYDEAIKGYHAALSINPELAEAHNNLGAVYYRQGRFEEAASEFQSAARLKPGNADFKRNLRRALEMVEQRTP